jgi:hypothetical protein
VTAALISDDIVDELIEFLGGTCALCEGSYPDGRSWTIHHRRYVKGEKDSKDFKTKIPHVITRGKRKGTKTFKIVYQKQKYYEYLKPIVYARLFEGIVAYLFLFQCQLVQSFQVRLLPSCKP